MCLLREMYGPGVERLRIEHRSFLTPSKKKVEITTIASNYHIEVNPSDCGIYDRVVIQELIKTVASAHQLNTEGQREFKVVVLTEVDKLTKDAQHALRRTMEKHMATCRVILVTNSTSKVGNLMIDDCQKLIIAPCTLQPAPSAGDPRHPVPVPGSPCGCSFLGGNIHRHHAGLAHPDLTPQLLPSVLLHFNFFPPCSFSSTPSLPAPSLQLLPA